MRKYFKIFCLALALLICIGLPLTSCQKKEAPKITYRTPDKTLDEALTAWNEGLEDKFATYFLDPEAAAHFISQLYTIQDTNVYSRLRYVTAKIIQDDKDTPFNYENPPSEYNMTVNIYNTNCYVPFYNYLVDLNRTGAKEAETTLISKIEHIDTKNLTEYPQITIKFIRNSDGNYVLKNGNFHIDRYDAHFSGNISNLDFYNALSGNIMNSYIDYYTPRKK